MQQIVARPVERRLHKRPETFELCWARPRSIYAEDHKAVRELIDRIDDRLPLRDGLETYGDRVSFADAMESPVHRWYRYKEGFSPELLELVLDELEIPAGTLLLDSFGGVGTSVLAASMLDESPLRGAVGVEYNPFAAFVARTKLGWWRLDPDKLRRAAEAAIDRRPRQAPEPPPSATLNDTRIYPTRRLNELLRLRAAIDRSRGPHRDALRLALASILEPASYAKKDGRALRIIPAEERPDSVLVLFNEAVEQMAEDLERLEPLRALPRRFPVTFTQGDARRLDQRCVRDESVGLALFSPPYLNGIDYSEVYKVEEWFFGFVSSEEELYELREGTLRSHPSIRFPTETLIESEVKGQALVRRALKSIEDYMKTHERRAFQAQYSWLIPAYFDDMYRALKEQARVLVPGGYAVCVVANSMFSDQIIEVDSDGEKHRHEKWRIPLPTDAFIAELARFAGLEPVSGIVARTLVPRNVKQGWSRETLVVMRKPTSTRR